MSGQFHLQILSACAAGNLIEVERKPSGKLFLTVEQRNSTQLLADFTRLFQGPSAADTSSLVLTQKSSLTFLQAVHLILTQVSNS